MQVLLFSLACLFTVNAVLSLDKQRDCKCRIQTSKRIVGGRLAGQANYPWQMSILGPDQNGLPDHLKRLLPNRLKIQSHRCGGVVINERWMLTAAHCVPSIFDMTDFDSLTIGLGSNDLVEIYDKKKVAEIERFIPHPGYNFLKPGINDIALIQLKEPLSFNATVQPAFLETKFRSYYEGALKTTGYGVVNKLIYHIDTKEWEGGVISRYLKEADVFDETATAGICAAIRDQQNICTNGVQHGDGRETACKGDSGGPLHAQTQGKTSVIGLVSFGKVDQVGRTAHLCTGETAYTRVSRYIDWIKKYVGDFCE